MFDACEKFYFLFSFSFLQPVPIWCIMFEPQYVLRRFSVFSEFNCSYKLSSRSNNLFFRSNDCEKDNRKVLTKSWKYYESI